MIKPAVAIELPGGKLPGYYAQFVKALAGRIELFDREKELLILNSEAEREEVERLLDKYKGGYERLDLRLLPADVECTDRFGDYGFTSRLGRTYAYSHLTSVFRFPDAQPANAEPEPARLQMAEHWLAAFTEGGVVRYLIDREQEPLIRRIAEAYGCEIRFEDGGAGGA